MPGEEKGRSYGQMRVGSGYLLLIVSYIVMIIITAIGQYINNVQNATN